jgi:hypothetical protein
MQRNRQEVGPCPHCATGTVTCLHNRFANDMHRIDSWEHRCSDCGKRDTEAFRKLADEPEPEVDPLVCPYCGRKVEV